MPALPECPLRLQGRQRGLRSDCGGSFGSIQVDLFADFGKRLLDFFDFRADGEFFGKGDHKIRDLRGPICDLLRLDGGCGRRHGRMFDLTGCLSERPAECATSKKTTAKPMTCRLFAKRCFPSVFFIFFGAYSRICWVSPWRGENNHHGAFNFYPMCIKLQVNIHHPSSAF